MPQAVLEYLRVQDFNFVLAAQKNINDAYVADMAKYAQTNETTKIMAAFSSISAQLAKENNKFQYKIIKTGARAYSLNLFITRYQPIYSIRISAKNFCFENGIKSVPLYAVFCI
jgi:hypothetical protein